LVRRVQRVATDGGARRSKPNQAKARVTPPRGGACFVGGDPVGDGSRSKLKISHGARSEGQLEGLTERFVRRAARLVSRRDEAEARRPEHVGLAVNHELSAIVGP